MRPNALPTAARVSNAEVITQSMNVKTGFGNTSVYIHTPAAQVAGANYERPPLIINMHGGGFMEPYKERDRIFCRALAKLSGCIIFDIDYVLAPEHPFPEGLDECFEAVLWAYAHADELRADKTKLILLGHSSGGNFAAVIARRANKSGALPLAAQILDYPPADLFTDPEQKYKFMSLPAELMRKYDEAYVPDREARKNPDVSPLYTPVSELTGMCRALIIACELDCLADEAIEYADKLKSAGVETETVIIEHALHGVTVNFLPGWSIAVNAILNLIGSLTGRTYAKLKEAPRGAEEKE